MALPVGVTSALAHIDAPVSFGGTPAKVYLEVVPNIRLNHIATGTPLANFIDVRTPGIGDPATVTLPHTDQAGFQDESGLPVTNWSYAATIRYELDGQLIHVPTKHFQILTGQTDVDLALIPVGEPTEIILGNVAFVSSLNGRSGAVTLTSGDLGDPIELSGENLNSLLFTKDYVQSQSGEATLALNYPIASKPGFLRSRKGTNGIVTHEYTTTDDIVYVRRWNGTTWTGWAQIASFVDPGGDRIVFWDDSADTFMPLTFSSPLVISGTALSVSASTESLSGRVELATAAETLTGTDLTRAVHPAGLKGALDLKNNVVALGYRARTGTDDPSLYPLGISNFLASSGDAWVWPDSASFKHVMTLRQTFGTGTGGTIQYASDYADNTKPIYYRVWDSDDTAWGGWYRLATTAYVDALIAGLTKASVGLANVDNTSDAAKPVSTAQQTALNLKANLASPTFTGTVGGITKSMVGLGNVDNTSDLAAPISTATQSALDAKAPIASPTFTGTVSGVTKAMVGLGNVDNTSDLAAPISTATQTALDLKQNVGRAIRAVTANTTVDALTDDIILVNSTTTRTISLPDPANAVAGKLYTVKNINTASATVVSLGTSKTLDGAASQSLAQWAKAMYVTTGAQWYTV